jgi:polysaccharide export outer membrane protein
LKSFIDKGFIEILIFVIVDEFTGHVDCLSVPIFLSQDKTTAMAKTISLAILMVMIGSCVSTKNIGYFNNARETEYASILGAETAIQANDILNISISSLNPEASAVFNTTNGQSNNINTSNGNVVQPSGYLVNAEGFIQLPILGNIHSAGLTKKELKDKITNTIVEKKLLVDPIVSIRHLSFEVTVIGEVGRPMVIPVPNEKISLLTALGQAGDITVYGKKDNVLVIRESNGKKVVKRINLNTADFLNSSYYYLKPNDIVYVEPNKNKLASVSRGRQLLPALLSGLSVVVIVLDRIF